VNVKSSLISLIKVYGMVAVIVCLVGAGHAQDFPYPDRKQPARYTIWGVESDENDVPAPDFPAPSDVAFDADNRPWMLCTEPADGSFYTLSTLQDGEWRSFDLAPIIRRVEPELRTSVGRNQFELGWISTDRAGAIYAIVPVWTEAVHRKKNDPPTAYALVATQDGGDTFSCTLMPGGSDEPVHAQTSPGVAMLEADNSAQPAKHPPAVANWIYRKPWQGFAAVQTLDLHLPRWTDDGELDLGAPIRISERAMGAVSHSGSEAVASTADRVFVAYLAFPDSDPLQDRTVLRIAEVDRASRKVVRDVLVEDPVKDMGRVHADIHPSPAVAVDSTGVLHVISGSHNRPFRHFRSRESGTLASGVERVGVWRGRQSYPSFVITPDDAMHVAYRIVPALYISSLRPAQDAWQDAWHPARKLVAAPPSYRGYTAFYHKLRRDRRGALFLPFTFFEFSEGWEHGHYPRSMLISTDGGQSWQLASTEEMADRITPEH